MQEEWKPIKDFENSYEVSNLGNIRSIDRYCIQKNNRSEKYNHIYKGTTYKKRCELAIEYLEHEQFKRTILGFGRDKYLDAIKNKTIEILKGEDNEN